MTVTAALHQLRQFGIVDIDDLGAGHDGGERKATEKQESAHGGPRK